MQVSITQWPAAHELTSESYEVVPPVHDAPGATTTEVVHESEEGQPADVGPESTTSPVPMFVIPATQVHGVLRRRGVGQRG